MASHFTDIIKKRFRPRIDALRDDIASNRNRDFFRPTGTQVYCGIQGSGKTVSAVYHVHKIKERYPKAIIVSNLDLKYYKRREFANKRELNDLLENIDSVRDYIYFKSMEELEIALVNINNGFYGVIYLIDEIHTYFNALDSKNIPMYVFTEISQQRKQRKCIIGTSQLFLRMAKPFREQCDNLIICNTLLGVFTMQKAYDGMSLTVDYDGSLSGKHKKTGFFWHSMAIRNSYDTYQKVVSGAEQYEQLQKPIELVQKGKKFKLA